MELLPYVFNKNAQSLEFLFTSKRTFIHLNLWIYLKRSIAKMVEQCPY